MSKQGIVTSVHQRLQQIAKDLNQDFNSVQLRYVQERFLYRLSQSQYKDSFILKGALLFVAFGIPSLRPTKDIDFLGRAVSSNIYDLEKMIKSICSIEYEDAVVFDPNTIEVKPITEEKDYPGTRVRINAKIGNAKTTLWLDFGFGDIIVAGPIEIDFPILLDFAVPKIKVYSLESAIAEKFEACIKLNFETSRMKDFYDIHELASKNKFDLNTLSTALNETFSKRETELKERNIIFSDEFKFDEKKAVQWKAFLRRTSLNSTFSFDEIMTRIEKFIEEACEKTNEKKYWDNMEWIWQIKE